MANPGRTAYWETFGCMYGLFLILFATIVMVFALFIWIARVTPPRRKVSLHASPAPPIIEFQPACQRAQHKRLPGWQSLDTGIHYSKYCTN
jgi:hypothetical protein